MTLVSIIVRFYNMPQQTQLSYIMSCCTYMEKVKNSIIKNVFRQKRVSGISIKYN